ncbi:unnamed protein product [Strongylus vulgaris]|uniref:Uncharacterized protein n=1 Tax=Strongylus vulgaris TaxID=40348 RepID=A0A3P7IER5_STRVU|nr:unnamed protein product [Strongylus vulgaris]
MVVTEDVAGRVHFEYRELLGSSCRKWFDRPSITTRTRHLSRGCPSFPNPAHLTAYLPSPLLSKNYEYERYDNVTPEPQYLNPYQLFYEPAHLLPGSSSSEYRTPSPYRTACHINVPVMERSVYYYSQDDDSQLSDDKGSNEEHSLVPVSCGEHVFSFVQGLHGKYPDLDVEVTSQTASVSCAPARKEYPRTPVRKQKEIVNHEDVTSNACSNSNLCSSKFFKAQPKDLRFSWRRKLSAAAKNPLAPPANTSYALSSTNIGNSLPATHAPVSGGVTPVGTMVHAEKFSTTTTPTSFFSRKDKKKKGKRPRIRKEDISNPTNFQ